MKKFLKGLGAVIIALVLALGGYFAGQRVQISSIISAMPKKTMEKQPEERPPINSANPDTSPQPDGQVKEPELHEMGTEDRVIAKSETSAVDETWSEVDSAKNTTSSEALTLYTSAQKYGDEFEWDDSNKWVLELSDGNGGYYTLYDQRVTNGSVYFEVATNGSGDKVVYVYTITGAGVSVNQYTRTETGFTERVVFNSGAVNRTFSSVPQY